MYVHMHRHVNMRTCMYKHTHAYKQTYMYMHMCMYVYVYMYMYIYMCMYIYMYMDMYMRRHAYTHTYIHSLIRICIYLHLHIYICMYIYMHIKFGYIDICIYAMQPPSTTRQPPGSSPFGTPSSNFRAGKGSDSALGLASLGAAASVQALSWAAVKELQFRYYSSHYGYICTYIYICI